MYSLTTNHLKSLEYLGDIEGANKSWDKAMTYYDKLRKLKPSEANYHYKYGGCLGMKAKESFAISRSRMVRDYENPQVCFYAIPARYLTDTKENLDFCLAIGGAKLLEGLKSNN